MSSSGSFRLPTGCAFDVENNRLVVCDTQRGRLQVYIKDHAYQDPSSTCNPGFNLRN